ncbi:MAG: RagB/SusD family nutrient uptake outer membrane protein [Bacteroidota bacterium]
MRKILLGLFAVVLSLTVITSCKKLDLSPYNAVDLSTGFVTLQDAKYWNTGIYSAFRGRIYGGFVTPQEVQSDQLNATLDFGNRNGAPHRWGTFFLTDDVAGIYSSYYSALANVNIVIEGYDKITVAAGAQTDSLNTYKADAYMARAFYHHQLVLRYAKAYNPATATTDLGVPVITKYDVLLKPSRATMKAVYDQIISDINFAKANNKRANRRAERYFTPDAVLALEARVKLFMQDFAGAYTAANTVIASNRYPLYTTAAGVKSYWHTDATQEDIMRINATLAEGVNTNAIYQGLVGVAGYFQPDFVPTQGFINSYDNADFRKSVYFDPKLVQIQGVQYPNILLVNKFPGNPAFFTTQYTNYVHSPKVFRVAELYLIAAEAALGVPNEANALTAINALRTSRGLGLFVGNGTALRDEIRAERTRELAFEGYRIWDLKRWNLGLTRGTPQNTAFIQNGTGFSGLVVPAGDNKFTWGFPTNDLILNPNIVQNPGW